jgi:hypothetical protein
MQHLTQSIRKMGIVVLCSLGLSACAINPPKPLPPAATKTAPMVSLKAVGLSHPKTVWVPAFYTGGSDDLLYIDGQRYTAPNGAGNVVGFLPTATGYTVAVENTPVPATLYGNLGFPIARLQRGSRLELYAVSPTGKTIKRLADVRLHRYSQIFQTDKAFWIQRVTGWIHEPALGNQAQGSAPLYSYTGLTATGRNVSGPTNVYYATPAPGGGWYEEAITTYNAVTGIHFNIVRERNGQSTVIGHSSTLFRNQPILFHSLSVFVNEPPIVDSERTGMVIGVNHPYNPIGDSAQSYIFACYLPKDYYLGRVRLMYSLPIAYRFAQREALIGTPTDTSLVRQVSNPFGPVYVGLRNLQTKAKTPVFGLVGTGSAIAGVFFGANSSGQLTINQKVDAFTILTPQGAVILGVLPSGIVGGYAVAQHAQIAQTDAQQFASTYGLLP